MNNKFILLFFLVLIGSSFSNAQETGQKYEMKKYYFVMLTKGQTRNQDSVTVEKIQKGHMENITRLAASGKLIVAGPFLDDKEWRGIFIFDCETEEEAVKLVETDPAVKSGRLAYEIHPWMTAKGTCFK